MKIFLPLILQIFFISSQYIFINEQYTGPIFNGSIIFPFSTLSQIFNQNFTNSIEIMLQSDIVCRTKLINDNGLRFKYTRKFP